MKYPFLGLLCVAVVVLARPARNLSAQPPYSGTGFVTSTLITPEDPTLFQGITATGRGDRLMFDRRVNNFVTVNAFLFDVAYSDGSSLEAQVNPEFGDVATALGEATTYARYVGQLPKCLRRDIEKLWIQMGDNDWGGGNNSILVHTGRTPTYLALGSVEEIMVHEAAHTSLDADHAQSSGWLAAGTADGEFISYYAKSDPLLEDVAESFLVYFALKYRPDRLSENDRASIAQTIPNRIAYFDTQKLDVSPFSLPDPFAVSITEFGFEQQSGLLNLGWTSEPGKTYRVQSSPSLSGWVDLGSPVPSEGSSTSVSIPGNPVGAEGYFQIKEVPSQ